MLAAKQTGITKCKWQGISIYKMSFTFLLPYVKLNIINGFLDIMF